MTKQFGWHFDNSYSRLPKTFYTKVAPDPVEAPGLVILNQALAEALGLNSEELRSDVALEVFAGNTIPNRGFPLAQAYAGHQFGHFTMLGDGRAILLGEQITPKQERFDIQLKGPGRTPYSRGGDGRATLGPMLREYIISEAMHALGIPTTRSLAVVTTGEPVMRETELPGAILTRVASSHLRVGTFQYAANFCTNEELQVFADYAIKRHFPHIEGDDNKYLLLLKEVIKRQASLISKWQLVGFIHGVMNTDNMTISGETIDYGPCAFMDIYDPATVFSSIDRQGRYAYGNQPYIGGWNLARLAETLLPFFHDDKEKAIEIAQDTLGEYSELYQGYWLQGMRAKLGIANEEAEDGSLIEGLLTLMKKHKADFTNTFRALSLGKVEELVFYDTAEFTQWYGLWQERVERQDITKEASRELMKKSNPAVIPRNHRVEEALDAAVEAGDYSVMDKLLKALSNPYEEAPEKIEFCKLPDNPDRPYQTYCGT